ncbi:Axonemal dynein light chain domain-containing protein 1 [Lamellibrachia satsuma]|nr:Axonemal dynein light chain domain-containing protein 1 [Lamellibrachia satsuma]
METATMVGRVDQSGVDIIVPGTPGRLKRNRHRSLVSYKEDREVSLPELRQSTLNLDRNQPLPTSLQSDFIPAELLLALTEISPPQEQLGPTSKQKRSPSTVMKKSPANMWNFPTRRSKYKHLTDSTPCICGAGQDISFLYDVPGDQGKSEKPNLGDNSELRHDEAGESKHMIQLPDTLIPSEYHIVKNKGVLGLDYFDDKYGLELKDHEKHLVLFPSMHPTTRFEVLQLRKTMFEMLDKIGIDDEFEEVKGPTQMHSLLELMKKEQNIYNIIFHELIRQVSVHCIERGALLAEVRDRYSRLLNRVPRQIKGLHEEVLAQRALDRRLTEELLRFKTTISFLTSELTEVKEHDREVTIQANQALDDLKTALGESQRNAALLAEYHDLYELQRQRLERQVGILSSEKELWSTAAYSLALKVTEEHSLNTAKRLHVSEKAWAKLANHFTVLLSDRDTEVLIKLQSYTDTFRDILDTFSQKAMQHERSVREKLTNVMGEMHGVKIDFQKNMFGTGGDLQNIPDMEKVTKIYCDIKRWGAVCSDEMECFGGEALLSGQDTLRRVTAQVEGWTDCAIQLFSRHNPDGATEHPNHAGMLRITEVCWHVGGNSEGK